MSTPYGFGVVDSVAGVRVSVYMEVGGMLTWHRDEVFV